MSPQRTWTGARLLVALLIGTAATSAYAQTGDESPPQLVNSEFFWVPDGALFIGNRFACDTDFGALGFDVFPYDPTVDTVDEYDYIIARITIFDEDFDQEDDNDEEATVQYRADAAWIPFGIYLAPEPPPIAESQTELIEVPPFNLRRTGNIDERVLCTSFSIPQFNGENQAKLRGIIDYDVQWNIVVSIADENAQNQDQGPFAGVVFQINLPVFAEKDPFFLGPNPQAYADAGADQRVEAGTTVTLNGDLTFDSTNVGFDVNNPDIFARDFITFTWEWVSGPIRVDPTYPDVDDEPAKAEVTLTQVGTYVYRLLTDDNVNGLPTEDTVEIEVVSVILDNTQPVAVIEGPTDAVVVGDIIQLNGGDSNDPDGDSLNFRWIQTNEIGTTLDPAVIADVFQPLSGLDAPVSMWQAVKPGDYFFRLIVDDGEFFDTATFMVTVVNADGSAVLSSQDDADDRSAANNASEAPVLNQPVSGCGGAALPLGMVGFAMLLWRRLS